MQRFATPAPVDHVSLMRSRIRVSAVASMNQSALNVAFAPAGTMMFVVMSLAKLSTAQHILSLFFVQGEHAEGEDAQTGVLCISALTETTPVVRTAASRVASSFLCILFYRLRVTASFSRDT